MRQHPFDLLMELDTEQIRLDCAALHLARDHYPDVNLPRYLAMLDDIADEVAALRPGCSAPGRYAALCTVLVETHGFSGAPQQYAQPDANYLNRVLDNSRGVPIALAIIWLEVARRLKWPVSGVGLPGHFIVRVDDPEVCVFVDPFHAGRLLSVDDCRALVEANFDGRLSFSPSLLDPVNTRAVLLRMLHNLKNLYLVHNDLPGVANVLRRMAAVEPSNGRHLQDLAAVCCRRGDVRGACAHLQLYLNQSPEADDSLLVRRNLRQLQAALLALN